MATAASIAAAVTAFTLLWPHQAGLRRQLVGAAALILLPVSCGHVAFSNAPQSLSGCVMQEAGGATYVYAQNVGEEGFFCPLEPYHAIAVRTSSGFFKTEFRITDSYSEDDDEGTGWPAPVIGPAGHRPSVVTENGLVAMFGPASCHSLWDAKERLRLWPRRHREHRGHIPLLALLAPDEEPSPSDVADIVDQARHGNSFVAEDDLTNALEDTRSSVRAAARSIAEAGGVKMYPRATAALAASHK